MPPKRRAKGGKKPAAQKVRKKHWAVQKMLTHGGNVIVARKRRGGVIQIQFIRRTWKMHPNYGRGLWNIAGGGKNGGETGEAAAGREFFEETKHELKDHAVNALDECWFLVRVPRDFTPSPNATHAHENHIKKDGRGERVVDVVWQDLEEVVDILTLTHARRREFYDKYNGMKKNATATGGKIFAPTKYGILAHYKKIQEIMA